MFLYIVLFVCCFALFVYISDISAKMLGTCKMRNETQNEIYRNEAKPNETKFTETKRNLLKRNEIDAKRNKSKRN